MSHQLSGISRETFERDGRTVARLRTPSGRAAALAAWLAATAAVVTAFAVELPVLAAIGVVAWIPAMGAVNIVAGGVTAMRGDQLDERELAIRERGLASAHRFTGVVLVITTVVAALAISDGASSGTVLAVLSGLMLVQLGSAPIAIALRADVSPRGSA